MEQSSPSQQSTSTVNQQQRTFHSTTAIPDTQTTPSPQAAGSQYRKVAIVVEHEPVSSTSAVRQSPASLASLTFFLNAPDLELSFIHAWPEATQFGGRDSRSAHDSERESLINLTLRQEQEAALWKAHLEQEGFHIQYEQTCRMQDSSARQILEDIQATHQDLLIVYTAACKFPGVTTRSSFALLLATHTHLPVLVLKRPLPSALLLKERPLKVLLGIDASEASLLAVQKLPGLIRRSDALVSVVTVQSPLYQENAVLAPYVNQSVLDDAMEANAALILEMVRERLLAEGLRVQNEQKLIGSPATELGYVAEMEHPDLIVLGSHNRKGFLAWLTGSVSSQMLHWDTHNILIVR